MYNKSGEDGGELQNDLDDSSAVFNPDGQTLDSLVYAPLYVGSEEHESGPVDYDLDIAGTDPLTEAVEKIDKIT